MLEKYDLIILGAGITGLSVAREAIQTNSDCKILVIEKERKIGMHGSGRNSGVLHSGIYYPTNTLKAKFCAEGSALMVDYCKERNLPVTSCGKVILPVTTKDESQIDLLYARGIKNGASVKIISREELKEIEPDSGELSPAIIFSSEVLPEPLAPEIRSTSPACSSKERSVKSWL